MAFVLARVSFLNINNICPESDTASGLAPGECFYYRGGYERIGMFLHIVGVLRTILLVESFTLS